jgi:NTE family protein
MSKMRAINLSKSILIVIGSICVCLLSSCLPLKDYNQGFDESDFSANYQYKPGLTSLDVPWDRNKVCDETYKASVLKSLGGSYHKLSTVRGKATSLDCRDDKFVGLAISGGGSRAAVFSAAVLFELKQFGVANHLDVVSAVSGGSWTAAIYAMSYDPHTNESNANPEPTSEQELKTTSDYFSDNGLIWDKDEIFPMLQKNYIARWFISLFRPDHILKFWFTNFNRTDIMASTFSNNMFSNSLLPGSGYTFGQLNPSRPNLIINATDFTKKPEESENGSTLSEPSESNSGYHFTFSNETFTNKLRSDLSQYPVASAVMASSSYPGLFNYWTLENFISADKEHYVHLFDGGASDNLGIAGLDAVMKTVKKKEPTLESNKFDDAPKLVILIDSYVDPDMKNPEESEPRGVFDYLVDTNFMDVYETLMGELRSTRVEVMKKQIEESNGRFIHLTLKDLQQKDLTLFKKTMPIGTNMKIADEEADCLKEAASVLVHQALTESQPLNDADIQTIFRKYREPSNLEKSFLKGKDSFTPDELNELLSLNLSDEDLKYLKGGGGIPAIREAKLPWVSWDPSLEETDKPEITKRLSMKELQAIADDPNLNREEKILLMTKGEIPSQILRSLYSQEASLMLSENDRAQLLKMDQESLLGLDEKITLLRNRKLTVLERKFILSGGEKSKSLSPVERVQLLRRTTLSKSEQGLLQGKKALTNDSRFKDLFTNTEPEPLFTGACST